MEINIIKDFERDAMTFTSQERQEMLELLVLASHPDTKSGMRMYYWVEAQKRLGVLKRNMKEVIERFIEQEDLEFSTYVERLRLHYKP